MVIEEETIDQLAASLGYLTERRFIQLAGITEKTAESWRKHRKGPAHVRLGNRVLYSLADVGAYLADQGRGVQERRLVGDLL